MGKKRRRPLYPGQLNFKWKDDTKPSSSDTSNNHQSTSTLANSESSTPHTSSNPSTASSPASQTHASVQQQQQQPTTTAIQRRSHSNAGRLRQQSVEHSGDSGSLEIDFILDRGENEFVYDYEDYYPAATTTATQTPNRQVVSNVKPDHSSVTEPSHTTTSASAKGKQPATVLASSYSNDTQYSWIPSTITKEEHDRKRRLLDRISIRNLLNPEE